MIVLKNCNFAENQSSSYVSKIYPNAAGDVLALQVEGANGVYYVEGRNTEGGSWIPLAGINLSTFTPVKGKYTQAGLYELGIVSVRQLRVRIESAEGNVSIIGQIISTEET